MKILKKLILASTAAILIASPALAQNTPEPGAATGGETWATMPVGSHVMIGGFIFLVVAGGLVLVNDDDNNQTPAPPPAPPATTTTTTTS